MSDISFFDQWESKLLAACEALGFDVAVILETKNNELRVIRILGDSFARPDLKVDEIIKDDSSLYENEKKLARNDGDVSFIPTDGLGSDCGFRIKKTNFLIIFDNVLSDQTVPEDKKYILLNLQKDLEVALS